MNWEMDAKCGIKYTRLLQWVILWMFILFEVNGKSIQHDNRINCDTEPCKKYARRFNGTMNTKINPCEDFYEFACGNWQHRNIEEFEDDLDNFIWVDRRSFQQKSLLLVKKILEEPIRPTDIEAVQKTKTYYEECTNKDKRDARGIEPLMTTVTKSGGWPVAMNSEAWKEITEMQWFDVHEHWNRILGFDAFFKIFISKYENSTGSEIIVGTTYFNSDDVNAPANNNIELWKKKMGKLVATFANATKQSPSLENINKDLDDVLRFRTELIKMNPATQQRSRNEMDRTDKSESMTFDEFQEWFDKISHEKTKLNWTTVIHNHFHNLENSDITENDRIIVQKRCIEDIINLIQRTPQRVIVNHIQQLVIERLLKYTTMEMRDFSYQLGELRTTPEREKSLWKECIEDEVLSTMLDYMYVEKYFDETKQGIVKQVVGEVKNAMQDLIIRTDWLDAETVERMKTKLNKMHEIIGYSEFLENQDNINQYYSKYKMDPHYFESVINVRRSEYLDVLNKLRQPWTSLANLENFVTPHKPATFYSLMHNLYSITAAHLQWPVFDHPTIPPITYGALGTLVGSLISDGYRAKGRLYDENGKRQKTWSQESEHHYDNLTSCFVDQYGKPTVKEFLNTAYEHVRTNGERTKEKNVRDNTGVLVAYEAYNKTAKNHEFYLEGVNDLHDDQLFFLSYANVWCQPLELPKLFQLVKSGFHSTPRQRINLPLSNMPAFSKAFNCPENTPMNPSRKCQIWGSVN